MSSLPQRSNKVKDILEKQNCENVQTIIILKV